MGAVGAVQRNDDHAVRLPGRQRVGAFETQRIGRGKRGRVVAPFHHEVDGAGGGLRAVLDRDDERVERSIARLERIGFAVVELVADGVRKRVE